MTAMRTEGRDERQSITGKWCADAFGSDHALDITQRAIRLLEEAIELYQSAGGDRPMAHALVEYIYARPAGNIEQELGGVGLTVLAFANAAGLSADETERKELERVLSKPLTYFHARNQAKNDAGFKVDAYQTAPTTTTGEEGR